MRTTFVFGLVLLITLSQGYKLEKRAREKRRVNCRVKKADVSIILDSSTSIDPKDYAKDIEFIQKLVDDMIIADDAVNVGLIQYSTDPHLKWHYKDYVNKDQLKAAVAGTDQVLGNTNTGGALKMMRDDLMKDARNNVPQVGIVITDGNSQDGQKTKNEAQNTRDAGATLIAVGVGKDVSDEELQNIATSAEYVIRVDDYESLKSDSGVFGQIMGKVCKAAPAPAPDCAGQKADIGIILDSSTSIDPEDFTKDVAFLAELAGTFFVSEDNVHIGLIQYSTNPQWQWGLKDHMQTDDLKGAFLGIKQLFGDTNTGDALNMARTDMFPADKGGRPGEVPQVAIVITDGNSQDADKTEKNAIKIKNEKVLVIAVGVGDAISEEELKKIATSPKHIVKVENYGTIIDDLEKIIGKVCEV